MATPLIAAGRSHTFDRPNNRSRRRPSLRQNLRAWSQGRSQVCFLTWVTRMLDTVDSSSHVGVIALADKKSCSILCTTLNVSLVSDSNLTRSASILMVASCMGAGLFRSR